MWMYELNKIHYLRKSPCDLRTRIVAQSCITDNQNFVSLISSCCDYTVGRQRDAAN